jgi:AraC-like DNA-binding protein
MPRKKIIDGYEHPIERTKLYDVPALELAKSIIEKDPVSHIHIPMLADKVGINEFKLKLGFRELFRTSPYQYRLHLCLEQIASKVGFDSYNGFSTAFKKTYNIAPTQYRNKLSA